MNLGNVALGVVNGTILCVQEYLVAMMNNNINTDYM